MSDRPPARTAGDARTVEELRAGSARLRVGRIDPQVGAATDTGSHGAAAPATAPEVPRWRELAELQQRIAAAADLAALGFVLVNETWRITRHRQAVLWRVGRDGKPRPVAASGLSRLVPDTPAAQWFGRLGRHLLADATSPLPADLEADRPAFLPGVLRIIPIAAGDDGVPRGLLALAFDVTPEPTVGDDLARLRPVMDLAWHAADTRRGRPPLPRAGEDGHAAVAGGAGRRWRRRALPALILAALLVLAIPVRQTVLAPAEVIALDAIVVAAPMDGVVRRFHVEPNQGVRRDQPILSLDDTTLRNRRAVAAQQLQVARAEVLAATQKSFTQDASRAELAALEGRVAERAAELAWVDEQLGRVEVRAPADGVVIFTDPNDWIGRPVSTGERVALVGDPASAGVLVWLSVNDALDIGPGAGLRLFLPTAPLTPLEGRLIQTSYQSVTSPDGIASYRLRARFEPPSTGSAPRIGLRGTARLTGAPAPLGYTVFRRPIAALREWTGW